MRTLTEIAVELVALQESGDTEIAHSRADDLLIEAIDRLATGRARVMWDDSRRVIDAWRKLDKWYA